MSVDFEFKMCDWLSILKKAKKSCIVDANLKKIHYQLDNGDEFVEEYNLDTNILTRRAWKKTRKIGGEGEWEIEIGDPEPKVNKTQTVIEESSCQPFITRRNTRKSFEWRIRNLPYPANVYSITIDNNEKCLFVRTSNKKYFKILKIPELERLNLTLNQENIMFQHKFNTLIITYNKPSELLDFEDEILQEVKKINPKNYKDMNNCKPS